MSGKVLSNISLCFGPRNGTKRDRVFLNGPPDPGAIEETTFGAVPACAAGHFPRLAQRATVVIFLGNGLSGGDRSFTFDAHRTSTGPCFGEAASGDPVIGVPMSWGQACPMSTAAGL